MRIALRYRENENNIYSYEYKDEIDNMILYGAAPTELSSGERSLEFKLYDASTGTIRPLVGVIMPGKTEPSEFKYIPDANYGSYDAPVVFNVAEALEQPISLARGWTWMSLYVDPLIPAIELVLPKDATILKRFKNIKSKTAFSSVNSQGKIIGEVEEILPGQMYKMQLSTKTDFNLIGLVIDTKQTTQTIEPGYNWIGSLSSRVLSLNEAFAELQPTPGDRVKNRTAFAEFSSKGYWEGTLESIVPGEGYIYRSMATVAKTFHYPSGKANYTRSLAPASSRLAPSLGEGKGWVSHYQPMDDNLFPDNMNILAVVKKNGENVENAEVAAFINDECRGAIGCNNGYYFLTVLGSSEDDANSKLSVKVWIDGEEYVVDNSLPFISDAFYGSLDEPYILDIDKVTGISDITADEEDDGDWWSLQGFKIGRKPTLPGVYIHHGQKVTIKLEK